MKDNSPKPTKKLLKNGVNAAKTVLNIPGLFKNFWKFLSWLLIGVLIGRIFKKEPKVINVDGNYAEEQSTKIGKVKQRGEGNVQDVDIKQELSGKEKRKAKKAKRLEEKEARKLKSE